jgi:hypothetical protein
MRWADIKNFCFYGNHFSPLPELLANLEKARAVEATPGTEELKTGLAIARQTIVDLQMAFW